ncbi:hypothetical protein METBIDRAFT_80025 [Metschnikowia bicuspidata var. bicuspidata NRRL YB-4993]|uniref:Association with the SNF1 complex (ASC) domain-containing protein n=1 Tax=Metschnikowia bicuspidata var. bicuspidata NRRL YB-4993 TaxID=869754 RepID=A0A1A0H585_9ASCO|nr:hypothetical protein METBIDRAFT_80025 [Metschnikowia bicuspidata var. bicuspidata NRRL YB-4993]OBA19083.1 hypothetical protein METBIDRAFT_80025 [Metschnikowia bicuspidata var. bicuspidata NRRL YB-4993]
MGNSTSSTRKSAAVNRHAGPFRKSYQSQSNHQNLEEEFSDLILHEVKRQKQEKASESPETPQLANAPTTNKDEFNELSHKILENEELLRNILPVTGSDDDNAMQVDSYDAAGSISSLENEDISKVDFTHISLPASARQPPNSSAVYVGSNGHASNSFVSKVKETLGGLVPVRIKWVNQTRETITKVSIIGSFSKWRDVIKLKQSQTNPNEYHTTIKLPLGVHKLLYVVNNEYRVLEWLPTATDQEGIFFNWFEVLDPQHLFNNTSNQTKLSSTDEVNIVQTAGEHNATQIQKKSNSFLIKMSKKEKETQHEHVEYLQPQAPNDCAYMASEESLQAPSHEPSYLSLLDNPEYSKKTITYSSEVPEMLVDYNYFKKKSPDYELPEPPQLPAHLNNVLLNKMSGQHQPPLPPPLSLTIPQIGGDPTFAKRPPLRRADSSYYASNKEAYHRSIPNHVILNHLMTTSIRNDVLTVACITRYSGKFVTQIMHSPADTGLDG